MDLCDVRQIRAVLSRHGFTFSKSLGQNFLTAAWVPEEIARQCGAGREDGVVEIGPGIGCLTRQLSRAAGQVRAVELDRRLLPVLEETLAGCDNVRVIQGDVLKVDLAALCQREFDGRRVYACANLPYYITTPAITALLSCGAFAAITVMVQQEVARRICAPPGSRAGSAFSVYVDYLARAEYLFEVERGCFVPQPKVDSAVIRLTSRGAPKVAVREEGLFFSVVRAAFGQRRKTLVNALSALPSPKPDKEELARWLEEMGLAPTVRGEALSTEQFAALSDRLWQRRQEQA